METLTPPPPPTTTTVKTPDPDSDPPPPPTTVPPPLTTTTNGVLKRHKPLHHHQPPPPVFVTYKECMKNHAAAMGGHAVDGCGEFMPPPSSPPPSHPTSLKCSACGCHRNFHRREPDQESSLFPSPIQHAIEYQPHHRHHPPPPSHHHPPPAPGSPGNSPSPPPISSSFYPSAPHMLLALSSGVSVPVPPAENNQIINHIPANLSGGGTGSGSNPNGKKRFRTRFTQEQKEKMHEIAERVGWKMQKRDEELIVGFCNKIGVDKNVFKVWMHNNKTTFGLKKDFVDFNGNHSSGEGIDFMISRNNNNHHEEDSGNNGNNGNNGNINGNNQLYVHDNGGFGSGGINVMCTKGSSSSS